MSIRILLVDDHRIMREGLRSLVEKDPGMDIVAEAENGRAALQLAGETAPDVVVMDVAMPDLNGIEATRQLLAQAPDTRVLALSMHSDRQFVAGMLRAGAAGYLLKECAFEELALAIRTVVDGRTYLSPGIAGVVVEDYVHRLSSADVSASGVLTRREREVLQLMAEGKSTSKIAECLEVSVKTIETYRSRLMDKLDLRSTAELTKYAIREGLTSVDR